MTGFVVGRGHRLRLRPLERLPVHVAVAAEFGGDLLVGLRGHLGDAVLDHVGDLEALDRASRLDGRHELGEQVGESLSGPLVVGLAEAAVAHRGEEPDVLPVHERVACTVARPVGGPAGDHRGDIRTGAPGECPAGWRRDLGAGYRAVVGTFHDAVLVESVVDLGHDERRAASRCAVTRIGAVRSLLLYEPGTRSTAARSNGVGVRVGPSATWATNRPNRFSSARAEARS